MHKNQSYLPQKAEFVSVFINGFYTNHFFFFNEVNELLLYMCPQKRVSTWVTLLLLEIESRLNRQCNVKSVEKTIEFSAVFCFILKELKIATYCLVTHRMEKRF